MQKALNTYIYVLLLFSATTTLRKYNSNLHLNLFTAVPRFVRHSAEAVVIGLNVQ